MSNACTGFRKIFNFERNLKFEGSFDVGPFRIIVPEELIGGRFAQAKTLTFEKVLSSSGSKHTVTERAAAAGDWNLTALVVEHAALDSPSMLMPDNPWVNGAYDLSLILSLLTGAYVAVNNESLPDFQLSPALPIVSKNFFSGSFKIDWALLPAMRAAGAGEALYALSLARDSKEGVVKLAMGSAALDGLVSRWHSTSKANRYTPEVKEHVKAALQVFEAHLIKAEVDSELIKDMMPRTTNLSSESALSKLTSFLTAFNMYPKDPDDAVVKRLRYFNALRNSVAHTGSLRLNVAGPADVTGRVAGAVAILLQHICRVYVAKYLLQISDAEIESAQKMVWEFFVQGTLLGQDILAEDYDTYRQRLIDTYEMYGSLDL
ncbi:hypothetical protein [Pseudomonas sp. B35(2017)]|uniref:hypothetical protein n=1 Tax=Pseudomonas sp. B35(2017) TaxID=1981722 RepID=UPI00111C8A0C|nr:hypothetical protein [Pseudomonas sp. B35(2017)]